jgi:hypothetical protein
MNQVAGEENATRQGQMLQQCISEGVLMVAVDWRQRNPVRLSVEGMVLRITIRGLGRGHGKVFYGSILRSESPSG